MRAKRVSSDNKMSEALMTTAVKQCKQLSAMMY